MTTEYVVSHTETYEFIWHEIKTEMPKKTEDSSLRFGTDIHVPLSCNHIADSIIRTKYVSNTLV